MHRKTLTSDLSVSGQIGPDDLEALAGQGVRAIINNRPDGEADDQPESAVLQAESERLGLVYRHVPVVPGKWTQTTVDDFARALEDLPAPAHAFCRSGMRSTSMWAMQACARGAAVNAVMQQARDAGHDLTPLYEKLCQAGTSA